jgi:DNA-binding FadR family transcriptional regulator
VPRDAIPDHKKLYAAIVASDARGAAEAARELIQLALDDTRSSLVSEAQEARGKRKTRKSP